MTYSEAIEYLYTLRYYGAKMGLENTFKLAELAGSPQRQLRFIHVAGTNGKGSTCAMLESICRSAGLKTGLFTSPHLVSFGERIQVNRRLIAPSVLASLVEELQPLIAGIKEPGHPTFFEVVTVLSLLYFARLKCDVVVWETGLGGRLDSTNIVTPLASVITNIDYDHQKWLGETLGSIAHEKAGIIKQGVPVVTGTENPEALSVIVERASSLNSPLTIVNRSAAQAPPLDTLRLPLVGEHQKLNAALAIAVLKQIREFTINEGQIRTGLQTVSWPGRMQSLTHNGRRILLDGAHNPAGAASLAAALKTFYPARRLTLILGILSDKDLFSVCESLAPLASRILLVPVHSDRTADPRLLEDVCKRANLSAFTASCSSAGEALSLAAADELVVVTGSLYLVGEVMELLQIDPSAPQGERLLNEWGAAPALKREKPNAA